MAGTGTAAGNRYTCQQWQRVFIIEDGYVKEDNSLPDEGAKTWKKGEF